MYRPQIFNAFTIKKIQSLLIKLICEIIKTRGNTMVAYAAQRHISDQLTADMALDGLAPEQLQPSNRQKRADKIQSQR